MTKMILLACLCMLRIVALTQVNIREIDLMVSDNKTTHLVFPFAIVSGDCGSNDIAAQKMNGANNVLQVRATCKGFAPTNLLVITADGQLYAFNVYYTRDPLQLNMHVVRDSLKSFMIRVPVNQGVMATHSAAILRANKNYHLKKIAAAGVEFQLLSIHHASDIMYYALRLHNSSSLPYTIGQLSCFIADKKQMRRSASLVVDQPPLSIFGADGTVKHNSTHTLVIALPFQTISRSQRLHIVCRERYGPRHLELLIPPRLQFHARPL